MFNLNVPYGASTAVPNVCLSACCCNCWRFGRCRFMVAVVMLALCHLTGRIRVILGICPVLSKFLQQIWVGRNLQNIYKINKQFKNSRETIYIYIYIYIYSKIEWFLNVSKILETCLLFLFVFKLRADMFSIEQRRRS